jgi:hypothetical protein
MELGPRGIDEPADLAGASATPKALALLRREFGLTDRPRRLHRQPSSGGARRHRPSIRGFHPCLLERNADGGSHRPELQHSVSIVLPELAADPTRPGLRAPAQLMHQPWTELQN